MDFMRFPNDRHVIKISILRCSILLITLKPTIHKATFVDGDTSTLLFVGVVYGNVESYVIQVT